MCSIAGRCRDVQVAEHSVAYPQHVAVLCEYRRSPPGSGNYEAALSVSDSARIQWPYEEPQMKLFSV